MTSTYDSQLKKMKTAPGFIAALDQSGGSTPKALGLYGIPETEYVKGETSMFDQVHKMRERIVTSKSFNGDRILAAILFEDTCRRVIEGMPSAKFLWEKKGVVPIIKIDQGLEEERNGVQLMKPLSKLDDLLELAKENEIFGTKARSVIKLANENGIKANVQQQFNVGKKVCEAGLHPIIEPEVDIKSPEKEQAEAILKEVLLDNLNALSPDEKIMLKLTIPTKANLYKEVIAHPNVLRVVALSGGYSRSEANELLAQNEDLIASFSRALTEGLSANDTADEFDAKLDDSIGSIYSASVEK
ncbi:fructose bisphosphate aldolase [Chaetoceros tenuissimus]|uniref:fructose-bisphosphate aldolase n=1 Tax=Chaetoceros tenuissimus TaxID=426638 RepID=A0AAD3DA47_9STRA|nr:fructose bisphosphate aldolase [Chaetoceros tenuissimus]